MTVVYILLGIAVVAAIMAISIYNNLVRYRVESDNAWSQIDVQLKRRHDLIPNLIETVKGVMNFERDTLTQVMQARANALGAKNMNDRVKAEGEISGFMGRLLAVWENYPQLKSNQNAIQLQEELSSTENRIAYSRGHFNDVTANYNTLTEQFPSNVMAGAFGFQKRVFFQVPEGEKEAPKGKL